MATATRLRTKLQMLLQIESSGFALGLAIFALFYPIVAIPGAATTDVGTFTIGGFWGTAQPSPGVTWSWGPGLGWWLLLVGVVIGVSGAVLPYLKSLRSMVPSASATRPST